MEKGKFIYEGKARQLYETDDKDLVIVHYCVDFLTIKNQEFATNSVNLPTSWLQTHRDLFGSFYLIFYLKSTFVIHLFLKFF